MAGRQNKFWGWDGEYLSDLVRSSIQDARKEYLHFLGEGNDLQPRASYYFHCLEDLAVTMAEASSEISPSSAVMGMQIPVSNASKN